MAEFSRPTCTLAGGCARLSTLRASDEGQTPNKARQSMELNGILPFQHKHFVFGMGVPPRKLTFRSIAAPIKIRPAHRPQTCLSMGTGSAFRKGTFWRRCPNAIGGKRGALPTTIQEYLQPPSGKHPRKVLTFPVVFAHAWRRGLDHISEH